MLPRLKKISVLVPYVLIILPPLSDTHQDASVSHPLSRYLILTKYLECLRITIVFALVY